MKRNAPKTPGADGLPGTPKTFTSPPMLGTAETWALIERDVERVADDDVLKPRIDLQMAAETVITVCDEIRNDPALFARFERQAAAGEFAVDQIRLLQRLAGGAWYARRMQLRADGSDSEATVPAVLVTEGDAVLARMLPVATYYLGKDPDAAPDIANINASRGHRRLANNLLNLADVYQKHRAILAVDTVNYRATDEQDARRIASAIIASLATQPTRSVDLWNDRCARVWTLLSTCYADVQAVGHYLLRKTPEAARERFPSLVSEARAPMQPRKPATEPDHPVVVTATQTPAAPTPKRKRRTR